MLTEYKKKTNIFTFIGLMLQILYLFVKPEGDAVSLFATILLWGGIILFTMGCWYYAKGKGYHGAYGLLGLVLNFFGLIILVAMPDKFKEVKNELPK